jgi:hypothetical protein
MTRVRSAEFTFNLHSPYKKDSLPKTVKPLVEKSPSVGD